MLPKLNESTTSIRIDKEIQQNIISFIYSYKNDVDLLMNIFIFLLDRQFKSADMFNNVIINVSDFQKKMNYKSKSNLQTVLENEKLEQFKKEPDLFINASPDSLLFRTRFENALYALATNNFIYSGQFNLCENVRTSFVKSEPILEYAKITQVGGNLKGKKFYSIKFNSRILTNLYSFYSLFNIEVYRQFNNNNKILYLLLCHISNNINLQKKELKYSFSYFVKAIAKDSQSLRKQRYEVVKAINNLLEQNPNFNFEILQTFPEEDIIIFNFKETKNIENQENNDNFDYFIDGLLKMVFSRYLEKYKLSSGQDNENIDISTITQNGNYKYNSTINSFYKFLIDKNNYNEISLCYAELLKIYKPNMNKESIEEKTFKFIPLFYSEILPKFKI